jgi:hypothetical protein
MKKPEDKRVAQMFILEKETAWTSFCLTLFQAIGC